ncbi:hypothetical protein JG688_00011133 [Phytophthora aleatoria]|uniref:Uncharacterized protein n=1 Tax=Phytophthora aleatoria TaxID=2496075 RepID=A0A8J5J4C3_9STRA|nr:hypothetical protein JG688_00011133 [Phytophthora aleatoria]
MVSRDPVMNEDSQTAVDVHPIASAQDTSVLDDIDTVDSKVHATAEKEEKKEVQDSVRSDKYSSECESSEQTSGVSGAPASVFGMIVTTSCITLHDADIRQEPEEI